MDCGVSCPLASEKFLIDFQWEKYCDHSSAFIFDWNFFILAGNKHMHKSLNEFEFNQIRTLIVYGVTCPWASEMSMYNVVNTLAPSFLIGSSSFLQVTRTSTKSRICSKFGQIRPWTAELAALERLNLQWEKWSDHSSAFIFDWKFFILACNKDNYKVSDEFEIQPEPTIECGVRPIDKIFYLLRDYPYFGDLLFLRWAIVALWATCFVFFFNWN